MDCVVSPPGDHSQLSAALAVNFISPFSQIVQLGSHVILHSGSGSIVKGS